MPGDTARGIAIGSFIISVVFFLCALFTTSEANQRNSVMLCLGGPALIISIIAFFIFLAQRLGSASYHNYTTTTVVSPPSTKTTQQSKAQTSQPSVATKTETAILARDTVLGEKRPPTGKYVKVKDQERQSGMYILGVQGVGKSSLLENMIYQDIRKGMTVIVLDPHGDLIEHIITQMPAERVKDTYLLSIEDTEYPFGVNLFGISENAGTIAESQAVDRILHVFEKCFPETSRMLLEKYLGNIAPVFFAHADIGYAMTDIPKFLRDEAFRAQLVQKARLFIRQFWQDEYATMSPSVQRSETASLSTRLNRFLRSPIVGNIIGQSETTIDFRKAIENKEIILIHLPVKTLKEDASLIGTMLIAQIHAAIFSFADTVLEKRPGFSLFVDEFQHFATSDFAEMFTEGRKFGSRVTVAHQFREQLPDYLASATLTARTIITFQVTQEDSAKMARLYPGQETLDVETIPREVLDYLLKNPHPDEPVVEFTKYLANASHTWAERKQLIKIKDRPSYIPFDEFLKRTDFPDSRHVLNDLLYRCMREQRSDFPLPPRAVYAFLYILGLDEGVKPFVRYDPNPTTAGYILMGAQSDSSFSCTQAFQQICSAPTVDELMDVLDVIEERMSSRQQAALTDAMDFIGCLRGTMEVIAANPLGEKTTANNAEVAAQIINLPRGHAFVKIGSDISEMATLKTAKRITIAELKTRKEQIVAQTRTRYCRLVSDVEQEIQKRLGLDEATTVQSPLTMDYDQAQQPELVQKQDWQPFDEV